MTFIGQERIKKELSMLLPEMRDGRNRNILFRGPSGYGKTTLGKTCAYFVGQENGEYLEPMYGVISLNFDKRVHFIDEVHKLAEPESLYSLLDAHEYTFILATNETSILREPLVNRCIQFYFSPYTEKEMILIAKQHLDLPNELLQVIVRNTNGNPRITIQYCERLETIFKTTGCPSTPEGIRYLLENVMGVKEGLTDIHIRYMDYIYKVKRASLDTISGAINIDKDTIRKEIEPVLLFKGLIKISSGGRNYVE